MAIGFWNRERDLEKIRKTVEKLADKGKA